jgi:hypothetical protein
MAKRIESKFLVIEGKGSEFLSVGMGTGGGMIDKGQVSDGFLKGFHVVEILGGGHLVCDRCDKDIKPSSVCYYVAVLNSLFCRECFERWHNSATYYESDRPVEQRNYDYYAKKLWL